MSQLKIDISFNFYSDSNGKDPDYASPTLRSYHKVLWSKILPNGDYFELEEKVNGSYLYAKTKTSEFYLGSDAITHSYKHHVRKQNIVNQIPDEVNELYDKGSTIGGYIIFPNNSINRKHTLNQSRGIKSLIDDRFDLTLECIKRFYIGEQSPLYETISRYSKFFNLFIDFNGYIDFFLLNDLIDDKNKIKFYLPFDEFRTKPKFNSTKEYIEYKKRAIDFLENRNRRISEYSNSR